MEEELDFIDLSDRRPARAVVPVLLRNAAIFALTLGVLVALAGQLPPRYPAAVEARLDYLREHLEEVDTLFLGSSAFNCHIDPARFDAVMAEHGRPTKSLNLGIQGMATYELYAMLREVAAMRPPRLKYVFVDAIWTDFNIPERLHLEARQVWWHDLKGTCAILHSIAISDFPLARKVGWAREHLLHFAKRMLRLGDAQDIYARLKAGSEAIPGEAGYRKIMERGGFEPLLLEEPPNGHRQDFLGSGGRSSKNYERDVQALLKAMESPLPPVDLSRYNTKMTQEEQQLFEDLGATVFFVLPANPFRYEEWHAMREAGVIRHLIGLNDPRRFPELFDLRYRYDDRHVASTGIPLYSRYLALEALTLLDQQGKPDDAVH